MVSRTGRREGELRDHSISILIFEIIDMTLRLPGYCPRAADLVVSDLYLCHPDQACSPRTINTAATRRWCAQTELSSK